MISFDLTIYLSLHYRGRADRSSADVTADVSLPLPFAKSMLPIWQKIRFFTSHRLEQPRVRVQLDSFVKRWCLGLESWTNVARGKEPADLQLANASGRVS